MNKDYKIERVGREGLGGIAGLYRLCFNKEKGPDFFGWKYFDNPAGEALCLAARNGSYLAGSCVMIPEDFYVFGKALKIYKCCDLMVRPDHRKQGLATRIIKALSEHLGRSGPLFLYTFCGKNATPGFLKNQWVKLDNISYYFKHKYQLKLQGLFRRIDRLYEEGTLREISSASVLCRDYKFIVDSSSAHIAKDERYLNWRLKDPRYEYRIIGYYEKDALRGYAIYNTGIGDNTYMIDLETDGGEPRIIASLLAAVESAALKAGRKSIIALTVKDTPFEKIVKKHGYIRNPFGKGPLASILDFNILIDRIYDSRLFTRSGWDLRPLNYDDI